MDWLRKLVNDRSTSEGRAFAFVVQALILISIISFSLETLPDLDEQARKILHWIEIITVAAFTLEYVLRLITAERWWKYAFSFYGLVDLIAIAPFYLSTRLDLRAIRILRIFRLFRLLRIERLRVAMERYRQGFMLIRSELAIFFMVTFMLLFISSVGIYYAEQPVQPDVYKSIFHSFWWATITLTTVGYGDMVPVTLWGRVFTFIILMLGLGIVAVPAGLIASALSQLVNSDGRDDSPDE